MLHALDVVIGLSAVYTAFGLLASWINETINSITSSNVAAKTEAKAFNTSIGAFGGSHRRLVERYIVQTAKVRENMLAF